MKNEKEIYLKLTEDEVDDVVSALHSQYENCDNLNWDINANDDLIFKINDQKECGSVLRPYIVVGVHDNGRQYILKKIVVMAEDAECAIEYAKKKLEKTSEDVFKVKSEDVHEMTDNEFVVMEA